jgi:large subunit ribosomal protein L4
MKLDVLNIQGEKTGKSVTLPTNIFGVEPNEHAVYLAVKQYLANQRQGTHKAKERGEIVGSTRKIKRQKGTGTARAGSIKSGVFRGGGRMFGPRPRNYGFDLNKKVKNLARLSALSAKASGGNIVVLEDAAFEAPKTSVYNSMLKALGLNGKKTLHIVPEHDENLLRSSNNIQKASVMRSADLNTYAIMNSNTLIISESSVKKMEKDFA